MTDLRSTIAEYLSLHAEAVEKSGLEEPELHPNIPASPISRGGDQTPS
jgi:hypothetical protein